MLGNRFAYKSRQHKTEDVRCHEYTVPICTGLTTNDRQHDIDEGA